MSETPDQVSGLELIEVADGFVVHHPVRNRVHFFNHTAAIVLTLCDGTKTEAEIARLLQRLYELPESPDREVADCLVELRAEDLVS